MKILDLRTLQIDSEKDIRARVERELGLDDGSIKREPELKMLFKEVVGLHLGIKADTSSVVQAYQVCAIY